MVSKLILLIQFFTGRVYGVSTAEYKNETIQVIEYVDRKGIQNVERVNFIKKGGLSKL